MIKILPHEIMLNLLKKHYSSNDLVSFNDLLINFKIAGSENEKIERIIEVLKLLEKKEYLTWDIHIKYGNHDFRGDSFKVDFINNKDREFRTLEKLSGYQFAGILTTEGLEYALDIYRKRMEISNANLAIIISIVAAIISICGLF